MENQYIQEAGWPPDMDRLLHLQDKILKTGAAIGRLESEVAVRPDSRTLQSNVLSLRKLHHNLQHDFSLAADDLGLDVCHYRMLEDRPAAKALSGAKGVSMPFSNELTEAQAERLALLLEEMGEAQQAIGKILRHGYESSNPGYPRPGWTNRHDLQREIGDICCAIRMMLDVDDLSTTAINARSLDKARQIKPYLHHQANTSPQAQKELESAEKEK
jgi:hypothetical protein